MSEQKEQQLLQLLVSVSALQEQMNSKLDRVTERLDSIELKVSKIEKCVSFENADFDPLKRKTA